MTLYTNTTVRIRNRLGEERIFDNCVRAYETKDAQQLIIEYRQFEGKDEIFKEEYDAVEWRIVNATHTEAPIQ